MVDPKMVSGIFNDFLALYTGKGTAGILTLCEKYENNPTLLVLLSNLEAATKIPVREVMLDVYGFYKEHRGRDMTGEECREIINHSREINLKWKENEWCRCLLLGMTDLLCSDEKERNDLAKEVEKEMEEAMRRNEGKAAA